MKFGKNALPTQITEMLYYFTSHYKYQHGTGAKVLFVGSDYSDVISPLVTFFEERITRTRLQCAVCIELLSVCLFVCDKTLQYANSNFHVERATSVNIWSACGQYDIKYTERRTYNYIRIITGV